MKGFRSILKILKKIGESLKKFSQDRCDDQAAIISFYMLLAAIPTAGVFGLFLSKVFGTDFLLFRSLHVISEDYFTQLDPSFFVKVRYLSRSIEKLGWVGLALTIPLGIVVFSKITQSIYRIFEITIKRSFLRNTLFQISMLFITGTLIFLSLVISISTSTLHGYFFENELISEYLNPYFISIVDNILVGYMVPVLLSYSFFFFLYKFLPPMKIKTNVAVATALVSTFLWEIAKRIFSWYLGNIALYGKLHGTLSSVVGFILLVNLSIYILLFGAELTFVFNSGKDESK
ncbi:MAG: YihY/virulence factor BrkB family protein [Acidobacteriota bacterium]